MENSVSPTSDLIACLLGVQSYLCKHHRYDVAKCGAQNDCKGDNKGPGSTDLGEESK